MFIVPDVVLYAPFLQKQFESLVRGQMNFKLVLVEKSDCILYTKPRRQRSSPSLDAKNVTSMCFFCGVFQGLEICGQKNGVYLFLN